ncbi:MAG: hypothetical protein QXV28_09295 [Ignisphaera sp.]
MKVVSYGDKSDSRLEGLISVAPASGEPVAISDERVKEFLLLLPFRIVIVLKNRRVVAKADRFSRSPCSSFTLSFYT